MKTSSNALTQYIRKEIDAHGGQISFANFMGIVLFHPEWGYYNSVEFTLGKEGDFITAPEISPLFANCFAKQFLQLFASLETKNVLELGAGTGRFAGDVLQELAKAGQLPTHYYIYEISISLRKKQEKFLRSTHPDLCDCVVWLDKLPENFTGIIVANEVLDVLPVHRFRIEEDGIKERCVTWENNQFTWKSLAPLNTALRQQAETIRDTYGLYPGYESELNLHLPSYIQSLTNALRHGVLLFADYGYGQREYYHPERNQGTLTCFYQHRRHADPLILPGLQDITAHVDFTTVAETAAANGCELLGYTSQSAFLLACGLMDFAAEKEKNLSPRDEFALHQAIKLLTLPTEMGERIKVMALGKGIDAPLMGFRLQDRRRDL